MSTAAGGVFVMKVNERSSKTVTSTGVMVPLPNWVWALKALQNSMMLMLAPPSASPTGCRRCLAGGDLELDDLQDLLRHDVLRSGPAGRQSGCAGPRPTAPYVSFLTWSNESSAGVSRPKMLTSTFRRPCSALISAISR